MKLIARRAGRRHAQFGARPDRPGARVRLRRGQGRDHRGHGLLGAGARLRHRLGRRRPARLDHAAARTYPFVNASGRRDGPADRRAPARGCAARATRPSESAGRAMAAAERALHARTARRWRSSSPSVRRSTTRCRCTARRARRLAAARWRSTWRSTPPGGSRGSACACGPARSGQAAAAIFAAAARGPRRRRDRDAARPRSRPGSPARAPLPDWPGPRADRARARLSGPPRRDPAGVEGRARRPFQRRAAG